VRDQPADLKGVVYLNGTTYRIRGGHCYPVQPSRTKRRLLAEIEIGLIRNPAAAPGRGISLPHLEATQPGPLSIDDSEIEAGGMRVAASGTAKGLKSGTFSLYGRDASRPTGVTPTGNWTCG
jgi:hypothetical protein